MIETSAVNTDALPQAPEAPCSRCKEEPRTLGQRWGKKCHTEYERERRKRVKPKPIEESILVPIGSTGNAGVTVCGKGALPAMPEGCGKVFHPKRNGQVYCCNRHGSGKKEHSLECPIGDAVTSGSENGERIIGWKGAGAADHSPIPAIEKTAPEKVKKKGRGSRPTWDPVLIERTKQTILEIQKYPNRPETIRVSFIPMGEGYADIRVYMKGRHTRQGLVIHRDLIGQVIAGLSQTLGAIP